MPPGPPTTQNIPSPYNPNDSKVGRIDQGVDITSRSPFTAIASGRVVAIDPNFYNGTPAVYVKLDRPIVVDGRPYQALYYSETQALVHVGQHVKVGQPITAPGSAEIGFAARFGSSWLPAAHGTYTEGHATQAGSDFSKILTGNSWSVTGAVSAVGGAAHDVVAPVEAVGSFLGKISSASFWLRAAEVVGGGLLLLIGLYLLARNVGLATTPPALPGVGSSRKLSDSAAAEMQFSPGRSAAPQKVSQPSGPLSEAAERRAAIKRRAAAAEPSGDIPF